eukprot:scaffold29010_cov60-Phaeocystis_antarctica.AAC.1
METSPNLTLYCMQSPTTRCVPHSPPHLLSECRWPRGSCSSSSVTTRRPSPSSPCRSSLTWRPRSA